MPRFMNDIDVTGYKLLNAVIHPLATDPATPKVGQIWFNTAAGGDSQGRLRVKLGTRTFTIDDQYVTGVSVSGTLLNGGTALAPVLSVQVADATHDGTMTQTFWNLINGATNLATPSTLVLRTAAGNASFSTISIANAPLAGTDGVNKDYADNIAAGFDPKGSVKLATTGVLPACVYVNGLAGVGATLTSSVNQALTTTLIDGTSTYVLAVGDRLLIKNQATASQNGIYSVTSLGSGSSTWVLTRTSDFDIAAEISGGAFMFTETGAYPACQWMLTYPGASVVVGSTALTFTQTNAASVYTAGNGLSLAGGQFSVNLTGINTLEFSAGALRIKSSTIAGAPMLSGGTGVEPSFGALNLAGGVNFVTGALPKVNGGFGQDVSTGIAQNLFAASPNGAAGAMSFRAMVAADVPALDFSKIATGTVPIGQGGTGSTTASAARTALGVVSFYSGTITGDGSATSFVITHNLNSSIVQVTITDPTANNEQVYPNVQNTTVNTTTVIFGTAPANGVVYNVRAQG